MSISIEKAAPCDAALILEYLKQVGGETDNLTFGSEGLPFSVESEMEFICIGIKINHLLCRCVHGQL